MLFDKNLCIFDEIGTMIVMFGHSWCSSTNEEHGHITSNKRT